MQKKPDINHCDHIIGLLHHSSYSELTTVDNLIKHIRNRIEWADTLRRDPCFIELRCLIAPVYAPEHYGDLRRKTDLTRFKHCPSCGHKIDWNTIKQIKV